MSLKQENLISTSVQYKVGQRLVKVGSIFLPVGFGGNFEPGKGGGTVSSSMKFYKCASVDTENKTWTGYELVLEDGVYIVSDTLTEDLIYTGFTPKVGNSYTADTLLMCNIYGIPNDGLVFYASLKGNTQDVAETGQAFTANKAITHTVVQGIPCIYVDDFTGYFEATNLPASNSSRTVSCWVKRNEQFQGSEATFFAYGKADSTYQSIDFCFVDNYLGVDCYHGQLHDNTYIDQTEWHNVVFTYTKETNTVGLYVDGKRTYNSTWERVPNTSVPCNVYIGVGSSGDWPFGQGYLSACRIYDRVLSQDEITMLSQEFTPTNEYSPEVPGDSADFPYGYRLNVNCFGDNLEFVQDDLTATGKARIWTCTVSPIPDFLGHQIVYEATGWVIKLGDIYIADGFGDGEDPYPCGDVTENVEITVIE